MKYDAKIIVTGTAVTQCWIKVKADSEDEARELAESDDGDLEYSDYDTTDQVDVESIETTE